MKKTLIGLALLSLIATTTTAHALPELDKLDMPATFTAAQRQALLRQFQSQYQKHHDQAALVEIECRLLEPLLRDYDASCPDRIAQLEKKLADLGPGVTRAWVYWVTGLCAYQNDDLAGALARRKAAIAEPGVSRELRARWLTGLNTVPNKALHEWMQQQTQELQKGPSSPALRFYILALQEQEARWLDNLDLSHSLGLARAELAQQQGWQEEEALCYLSLASWCPEHGLGKTQYWEKAFQIARGLLSEKLRDELTLRAQTRQQLERCLRELQPRYTADQCTQKLVDHRYLEPTQALTFLALQAEKSRQSGKIVDEINYRSQWGNQLCRNNQYNAGIRQLRAAFDLSLGQNQAFRASRFKAPALAQDLARQFGSCHLHHQQREFVDFVLRNVADLSPSQESRLRQELIFTASFLGDQATLEAQFLRREKLIELLPPQEQAASASLLATRIPKKFSERLPVLLRKVREWGERDLQESWDQGGFNRAYSILGHVLEMEGDRVGTIQLAQRQVDSATNPASKYHRQMFLMEELVRQQKLAETRTLVESMWGPATASQRRDILTLSCQLASSQDPIILERWRECIQQTREEAKLNEKRGILPPTLSTYAYVLFQFGRHEECLKAIAEISHPDLYRQVVPLEAKCHKALGHHEKGLQAIRNYILKERVEQRAIFTGQLPALVQLYKELGQEPDGLLQELVDYYASQGEAGQIPLAQTEYAWLKYLGEQKRWEQGRQLLTRYPWTLSGHQKMSVWLRQQEAWSDLIPAPSDRPDPPDPGGGGGKSAPISPAGSQDSGPADSDTGMVPPSGSLDPPHELAVLVDELRLNQPRLGDLLTLRGSNLKNLQRKLGPHDTLVTYCHQGDWLFLLALRREGSFWKKSQIGSAQLDQMVQQYLQSLEQERPSPLGSTLFSLLVEPVLREDPQQRLYVVPTGTLWQLPFAALSDSKGQPAALQAQIVHLTSGDLLRLADNCWTPFQLRNPLAIGAPPAADLPGAERELEEVSKILPDCQLQRGRQATLKSLYNTSTPWGLLHFASHAHYRPDSPFDSDIQLQDGNLKARQFYHLPLAEHSLVTLSVCQGGDSRGQKLGEPVTLATSFSQCGADTVVANLWQVDDEVALSFFSHFYRSLSAGKSPAQSFRQAQEQVRLQSPQVQTRDWAGFFLLGNPD